MSIWYHMKIIVDTYVVCTYHLGRQFGTIHPDNLCCPYECFQWFLDIVEYNKLTQTPSSLPTSQNIHSIGVVSNPNLQCILAQSVPRKSCSIPPWPPSNDPTEDFRNSRMKYKSSLKALKDFSQHGWTIRWNREKYQILIQFYNFKFFLHFQIFAQLDCYAWKFEIKSHSKVVKNYCFYRNFIFFILVISLLNDVIQVQNVQK